MLRNITIRAVANGYIVEVGCQTFVFKQALDMLGEIDKYLADPEGTEKRYRSEQPNMRHTGEVTPTEAFGGAAAPPPTYDPVGAVDRATEERVFRGPGAGQARLNR